MNNYSEETITKAVEILNVCFSVCDVEMSHDNEDQDLNDYTFEEYLELLGSLIDKLESDNDFWFELSSGDVRIINEDDIDDIWTESLIEMIKDCYDLSEIPSFVEIDWEQTADNCKVDGLGHHFNSYDGNEENINGFYIFRTN